MHRRASVAALGSVVGAGVIGWKDVAELEGPAAKAPPMADHYQLVNAHVVFRHGARTPVFLCPGMENLEWHVCGKVNGPQGMGVDIVPALDDVIFKQLHVTDFAGKPRPHSYADVQQAGKLLPGGQCRMGQLTDLGAQQAAQLGRELRERYLSLLDPAGSTVDARTTNVARCVASLSAVLGSLLPNSRGAITAVTKKHAKEDLTPNASACPRIAQLMRQGREDWAKNPGSIAQGLLKKIEGKLTQTQRDAMGFDTNNFVRYRDWVIALKAHGIPLPWELTDDEVDTLDVLGAQQVATFMGWGAEDEVACTRASLGKFLGEMNKEMAKAERRLYLVSAHDTTVLPLLIALDVFDGLWPPFCADVAVELWENQEAVAISTEEDDDRLIVRVVYNGEEVKRMSLSDYLEFCAEKVPRDWDRECEPAGAVSKKQMVQSRKTGVGGSNF